MMAASSFCNATYSWSLDYKPVHIIRYSFSDLSLEVEKEDSFHVSTNEVNGEFLQLVKKNSSQCYVEISCSDPQSAQVSGICILSESRTVEISSNSEGYIVTVRGHKIDANDGNRYENQPSSPQLYRCSYVFNNPKTDFQVKFMSLGNKDRFLIQSININIHQHFEAFPKKALKSTFDMARLKSDIEEMGDSVSDKALEFFKTLELYEQNKVNAIGSMFEQLDPDHHSQPQPFPVPSNNMMSEGLSSIMESVLGQETISSLTKNKSTNGVESNGGNVFSMLQAVCGEVSKMRKPESKSIDLCEETDTQRQELSDASTNGSDSDKKQNFVLNADFFMQVESRLEEAKTEMRKEIQTAKEEVMSKLQEINQDLDKKMNLILNLLQNNHVKENISKPVSDCVTDMDR